MNSIKARTFRTHLAITGFLVFSCSTLYWGMHPWNECTTPDKIISTVATVFIVQNWFVKTSDLPGKLRWTLVASILVFIYIHWIS